MPIRHSVDKAVQKVELHRKNSFRKRRDGWRERGRRGEKEAERKERREREREEERGRVREGRKVRVQFEISFSLQLNACNGPSKKAISVYSIYYYWSAFDSSTHTFTFSVHCLL